MCVSDMTLVVGSKSSCDIFFFFTIYYPIDDIVMVITLAPLERVELCIALVIKHKNKLITACHHTYTHTLTHLMCVPVSKYS